MLSRFNELCLELDSHTVTYDQNAMQLDFWHCLENRKETEFTTFINREREDFWKQPLATRPDIDTLIPMFMDKQTNMESDNKWNKLLMEQAQILLLLTKLESKSKTSENKSTDKSVAKKGGPRPWRKKGPKEGETLERVSKGEHTFK